MLINLKSRLDDPYIQELVSYSVFPDPDRVTAVIRTYVSEPSYVLEGLEVEGKIVGVIGYTKEDDGTLIVHHLAVHPEERGKEYGRGLMIGVIDSQKPKQIVSETDEEAVQFYRSIGFVVESIGEKYPGTERFRCTYFVDEAE